MDRQDVVTLAHHPSCAPHTCTCTCTCSNLWNEDEYHDRRIFAYERERGYFTWPLLSPLTSLVADVLLHKLLPPVLAAATAYPALGLRDSWAAWFDFLLVLCLVQVHCLRRPPLNRAPPRPSCD